MSSLKSLEILHFGKVLKKSYEDDVFEERYCVLANGIFAYFRTHSKATEFIDSLPFNDNVKCHPTNINNREYTLNTKRRFQFKESLKNHPPRGYIKLLDRKGTGVSDILIFKNEICFRIQHKSRYFDIQLECEQHFNQWIETFSALGLNIIGEKQELKQNIKEEIKSPIKDEMHLKVEEQNINSNDNELVIIEDVSMLNTIHDRSPSPSISYSLIENTINDLKDDNKKYELEDEKLLQEQKELMQSLKIDKTKIDNGLKELQQYVAQQK